MRAVQHAAVSVTATVLIAVTAYAGTAFAAAAVLLAVLCVAAGWGTLVGLPARRGSGLVVAASGVAALACAVVTTGGARPLEPFPVVLALSVLAAFGHELLRTDGRPRLVESVTGTFAGQVVAVLGAGWILLPGGPAGTTGVLLAAAAAAAARLVTALPWPLRVTVWPAVAAGAAVAALAGAGTGDVDAVPAAVVGASVALVVAALDRVLSHQPAAALPAGLLAAAAAPVVAAGTTAYAVARVVVGG